MRISDWSSDVCSSDLPRARRARSAPAWRVPSSDWRHRSLRKAAHRAEHLDRGYSAHDTADGSLPIRLIPSLTPSPSVGHRPIARIAAHGIANGCDLLRNLNPHIGDPSQLGLDLLVRSEEHTSELQSLMRISYAVFCLIKKHNKT